MIRGIVFSLLLLNCAAEDIFTGEVRSKRFCPPMTPNDCQNVPFFVVSDSTAIANDDFEIKSVDRNPSVKGLKMFFTGDGYNPNVNFLPTKLAEIFPNLATMEVNYQASKSIKHENFKGLSQLTLLEIKNTELEEITPGTFDDLRELRSLNLVNNKIRIFDENLLRNNVKLLSIDMGVNQISSLGAKTFENQRELKSLSIWSCKLAAINENLFASLGKLKEIDLRYNDFWQLPANVFRGLASVKLINLSKNKLTHLEEAIFSENEKLEKISLYQNKIHALSPNIFAHLRMLKIVDLGWNRCIDKRYGTWDSEELLSRDKRAELAADLERDCK